MKANKNIHILPTNKPSRLIINWEKDLCYKSKPYLMEGTQHIYITSDEEIKEDYVIAYGVVIKVMMLDKQTLYFVNGTKAKRDDCKKIILTTDQDLIKDGVQAIDDEFLEWFVKNPSCEEVEVVFNNRGISGVEKILKTFGEYKIIIQKEETKQEIKLDDVFNDEKKKGVKELIDESIKQETLEEAAERLAYDSTEENKGFPSMKRFIEGAKWQINKQDEFTLGFLHWYNTSQECETYLRRNYPKNITMNGEHYKKVLEVNKELLEMYKNTLPR